MSTDSANPKVKVGGWLIVVGVLLWLGVIGSLFEILAGLEGTKVHDLLITEIITFILYLILLIMFHQRKAAFVRWILIFAIYAVIDECYIQYKEIVAQSLGMGGIIAHAFAVVVEALLMTGVVLYFRKSMRVKQTFIR